ncbi:MAG: PAAR domain-containing protein [Pseudomonadota bacterium]|nr:PAAR domain-containing protein [Pseudomonadota bacterium]
MPNIIRLGDPTSHGGKVITADASDYLVDGIAVVRVDDLCSCPIPGHGVTKVVDGDPDYIVEGKPVAFTGHQTGCGAKLISTIGDYTLA